MGKDIVFIDLYEEYKTLLTSTQREIFYLYFCCDLSFTEISQDKNITRQSVSDTIVKTKKLLLEYEEKLGLLDKKQKLYKNLEALEDSVVKEELIKIIGEI